MRIWEEHAKQWLAVARKAEKDGDTAGGKEAATAMAEGSPETTAVQEGAENWTRVVDLVQAAFREGKLVEEAT